jgi:ribonuclease E
MSKEIYISSTPHETRLAIVEKDELTEIYYERENEYTLAGSIYNGRVTRVLPGMQSSFVDIGLERDAFLYITDFMEEAADSAEFEGALEGRAPRGERPARTESLGEPRGEGRSEGRSSEGRSFEGRSSEGRSSEGRSSEGRSEGRDGGRGRGRGRRDGRDNSRRRDAQPEPVRSEASPENSIDEPFVFAPIDEEVLDLIVPEGEAEPIGEGAPGADGSRRWRGRRGRRRGRGVGAEAGAIASSNVEPGQSDEADDIEPEVMSREVEPQREAAPQAMESRPEPSRQPRQEGSRDGGRDRGGRDRGGRDRGGRDRGGRDRGRDAGGDRDRGADRGNDRGNDRGSRDARQDAIRERFAPRGARPVMAGEEEVISLDAAASPEPFILPGESLSKYRRNEDGSAVETPAAKTLGTLVTARPSSEVAPLTGWDGGATLPGETLSRHREPRAEVRSGSQESPRRESSDRGRDANDRGRDRRRGRDEQRGRGGRDGNTAPRTEATPSQYSAAPRAIDPAEAVQPAVTSQQDFVEREYEPVYATPAYETQTDALPVETSEVTVETIELVQEFHEAVAEFREAPAEPEAAHEFVESTTEYEPGEDASASYRVDAAAPQEFRQSAPVEELEEFEVKETVEPQAATHEFTSIDAGGEMVSEIAEPLHTISDPAAPIELEKAIQTVPLDEALKTAVPFESQQVDSQQGFAPGDGQLEEELMDDEESEIAQLHASAFDDDSEEETLENAADLGSMIRDMSIDDITRPEPVEIEDDEDEDDDFEDEEDFEEDELESNGDEAEDEELSGSEISEAQEEEFAEAASYDENGEEIVRAQPAAGEARPAREGGRDGRGRGRRDGRRGGRDRERGSSDRGGSERSSSDRGGDRSGGERSFDRSSSDRSSGGHRDRRGMAGSRSGGRDRGGRSMQSTNLPAISDLLKPGQELLVQIAKEPIAKKGARITSHIALPGRFLVFMPTVSHTGVSRKIESDAERRRLKEILLSERGDATGGFIVRTAAAGASEEELRSDLRFLLNLWADIKARSESSKSPALIYHDLNLIERILRDQVTDNFSAIWVDTENEYERVLRFLQRFQPSLIRRVKLYTKDTPLFEQFGITEEINKALRAKVWLKSGGSIVINQTEALVAIDINTGKYVGKTARLEDTIVKTNLDAIPEIVRQIRLRDLGGIIIIDFIDMDERKNRNKVLAALEEELKSDRAPSKVLQFNDFGLVAITRKRVKQSLERTLSTTCGVCAGTGMVKSPVTVCNDIYIEMRKMHKLIEKGDIMLRVHPEVVKQLKTGSGKWLSEMEEMSGKTILVKSDPSLHPEQFDIH